MADLSARIEALARDHLSGASQLAAEVLDLLELGRARGDTAAVAAAVCRAQPSMAPVWNAAIAALDPDPAALDRFRRRRTTAATALERVALQALAPPPARPLRLLTLSMSGTVLAVLDALHRAGLVSRVACAEGRPAWEGRRMAVSLASRGIGVDLFTDAGVGAALDDADAALVGADAVTTDRFVNKVGTRALAALAATRGVPVHVVATGDKFVMPALWPHLRGTAGPVEEVWEAAPAGVTLHNPYFEETPFDLVTTLLTEAGALTADMIPAALGAGDTPGRRHALAELLRAL